MKISHIAIWTTDLEKMVSFYNKYFNCKSGNKYRNDSKNFESYFLSLEGDCKLELMHMDCIPPNVNDIYKQYKGIIHFAVSVGTRAQVDQITATLSTDGYTVVSQPRVTGDGYYESCVLDPEGNRVEITE